MTAPRRARRSPGRPTAITKLTDSPSYHNWLFYSDPGVGKTVLCGTAPRSLFLTVEAEGTQSAATAGSDADQWIINSYKEFEEARDYFVRGSGCRDFGWVHLDSASELDDKVCNFLTEQGSKRNSRRSIHKMALEDYQIRDSMMLDIVDVFNRLPINTTYTAHVMRFGTENEDGEAATLLLPLVGSTNTGKLATKVCGKVTLVGHLEVEATKTNTGKTRTFRRLYTESTPGVFAKNRVGLGPYVDHPTIPKLLDLVDEARGTTRRSTGTARRTTRRA